MPIEGSAGGTAEYLGLKYDRRDIDDVMAMLDATDGREPFRYVVTPNVDHVVRLFAEGGDAALRARLWTIYRGAWLCLCDSRVLARIARMQGVVMPVVPGSDLTRRLLEGAARDGDRVAIVGGTAATLAGVRAMRPAVAFIQHMPPMGMRHDPAAMAAAAAFVVEARPRFTLLAVGSPQQELLAAEIAGRGDATGIGLCIGASLDFLTGHQRRAPLWMQNAGLEWAHRLASSPRRMARRYLLEGPRIFRIAMRHRGGAAARD